MKNKNNKSSNNTTWSGYTGRWKSQNTRGSFENSICIKKKYSANTKPESKKR